MVKAFLARDTAFEGVFVTGVRSTGIFCRVGCPAKTPRVEQLEFFATPADAVKAGVRPCIRCRLEELAASAPDWLDALLHSVDRSPETRFRDSDIRDLNLDPDRVRRWFQKEYGMTFHAFARARRLGLALA